ncbi:metallophosphoesterase [Enterococcus asini]|uniref:metallophosphoesterase n=1 Tax=Enterococcus asini TaxID=57732 RepID=UPI00288EFF69|nr:metallophosphoesterase [Enterococcus asini]MDT2757044.1 metallophosphoesterase [Enterococcus asini]
MKKKTLLTAFLIAVAGLVLWGGQQLKHEKDETIQDKENLTFMIATDIHFLAPELHDDGQAFTFIKATAAGKDLDYQEESLQAFIDQALVSKPDGLILTGDLTLNGEKISAEKMQELFRPLKKAGISLYCIPGNHDLYDGWARSFKEKNQEKTPQISPEDFKKIFLDGYEQAISVAPDDLSYALAINSEYRFLLLDSNHYPMSESSAQPSTGGSIRDSTLEWLEKQLQSAKEQHQEPIVFVHHNLLTHNKSVNQGYVLDNSPQVKKLLKNYGVSVVFSGHIHAQDIMAEDGLTEIVTSSYNIIDHGYGLLKLSKDQMSYSRKTISVSDWAQKKKLTNTQLINHDQYLKELFLKDGERLAYETLLNQKITDEAQLKSAADFLAQVNLDYFQGNDWREDGSVTNLEQDPGYQLLTQTSFLKNYLTDILQDQNLNDQQWTLKK